MQGIIHENAIERITVFYNTGSLPSILVTHTESSKLFTFFWHDELSKVFTLFLAFLVILSSK